MFKKIKKILWAIFGNDDDWPPPKWYRPELPDWRRRAGWLLWRNPLHNFSFYVIGIAGSPHEIKTGDGVVYVVRIANGYKKWGRFTRDVFNPNGGWNYIVHYKKRRFFGLPFRSYNGRYIKCYAGWRELGNFGLKFNGLKKIVLALIGRSK